MRPYHKTAGRRKRLGIISPQYPYILNQIIKEYANLGRFSTIWLFLGPIFRKNQHFRYLIFGRKYLKNQNVINFRFIFPSLQSTHSTNITYKTGRSMLPKIMKNNLKCVSGKNAIFWFFEKFP